MPSRARAVEAIDAGLVLVGGAPVSTPARQVDAGESITVKRGGNPYVSRGGHKLAAGLDAFGIDVTGRHAIDVGSSTGGFTDCLLQRGAHHVVAIDVGRNQLAWSLRQDPRVTVMERTNVRDLDASSLTAPADLCVADLSFISLRTVAPHLLALTTEDADYVLLVKPQYEAGRARLGKGGIVREPEIHAAVLHEVTDGLAASGLGIDAAIRSPLKGADGNVEFVAHARRGPARLTVAQCNAIAEVAA